MKTPPLSTLSGGLVSVASTRLAKLESLVSRGLHQKVEWSNLWQLTRAMSVDDATRILHGRAVRGVPIHVRVAAGRFVPIDEVLLPGAVIPVDQSLDLEVAVDLTYHQPDLELLARLGVSDRPTVSGGRLGESWFTRFRQEAIGSYGKALIGHRSRPQDRYIDFDQTSFPGPLEPAFRLSPQARIAFTKVLLEFPDALKPWTLAHQTRRDAYPVIEVESPCHWVLREQGLLMTSLGPRKLDAVVGRGFADAFRGFAGINFLIT